MKKWENGKVFWQLNQENLIPYTELATIKLIPVRARFIPREGGSERTARPLWLQVSPLAGWLRSWQSSLEGKLISDTKH